MVCNLGALLDSQFLLEEQVAVSASKAFAQLWVVHHFQLFLYQEFLCSAIQALVISCLDYCNVL